MHKLHHLVSRGVRFTVMSTEWYENMHYFGMESLAPGTPIVVSNMGGIPELVVEGDTECLFPAEDAEHPQTHCGARRRLPRVTLPACRPPAAPARKRDAIRAFV